MGDPANQRSKRFVPPTIIYKKAANWVDRGESPIPTMRRVLAHLFERFDPGDEPWRGEVPANEPTPDTFSHWVASKLLTPDELSRFEDQLDAARGEAG